MSGSLLQDLRYGLRMLAKNRGFTAVAVVTLALGIGANTAIFSVINAVLLKPLSYQDSDRLVMVWEQNPERGWYRNVVSAANFVDWRKQNHVFAELAAADPERTFNLTARGEPEEVWGEQVTTNLFALLGARPFKGRDFLPEEDKPGGPRVVVLGYGLWQRRFGGDPALVGKEISLNNESYTVVGIMPAGFYFPPFWRELIKVDLWVPGLDLSKPERIWHSYIAIARLKPGVSLAQAQAEMDTIARRIVQQYPEAKGWGVGLVKLREQVVGDTRPVLLVLLGAVGFVLLIACANVANLLLVRASSRQKEIAVRLAMGASRRRLIRQLLTESLLLALLGGGLGVLFALWLKDGLLAVTDWSGRGMSALNPRLDLRVLGFTMGLSLLTGIIFGLVPAFRATRLDLTPALKDSGRSSSTASRSLLTKSLVVAQVSLSLLLLIGAGLLVRTLLNLQHVEMGFNARNLLLFTVEPRLIGYKDERLANLYQQMSERIEAVPGVSSVTFSRMPLLSFSSYNSTFYLSGARAAADGRVPSSGNVYIHQVRENFLESMAIPLLSGRRFTSHDDAHAPKVAVVNQTFAQRFFPNENPIGKRFGFDSDKTSEIEIVGLARDAKYTSQREETPPTAYLPWMQELRVVGSATFEVRTTGDPKAAITSIRQAVRDVDGNLPLKDIKTQIEQADETLSMERLFAKLLSLFGLLAQQLASIGLYGVLAWSVSQRTHEIGIRIALGASRGKVLKMILQQGMTLTLIGIVLGLGGAYVLTKYLESLTTMLYGVQPRDPLTFGVAATLLTVVALVACFVPARRATKVDPMVALRYE